MITNNQKLVIAIKRTYPEVEISVQQDKIVFTDIDTLLLNEIDDMIYTDPTLSDVVISEWNIDDTANSMTSTVA